MTFSIATDALGVECVCECEESCQFLPRLRHVVKLILSLVSRPEQQSPAYS